MSRLQELIDELCPDGVEYKKLGEVIISLNTGLNPRNFFRLNTEDATNYYITIREIKDGKIVPTEKTDRINDEALKLCNNRSNLEIGDILFSGTGTIGETAVITEEPFNWNIKEGVYSIKPNSDLIIPKFIRYVLNSENIKKEYMKKAAGGTVKSVPMKELKNIRIPVPPMAVQREIVRILDNFTALTAELTAELTARKKQYTFYRDQLLSFDDPREGQTADLQWKTLGEIGKVSMCKRILKSETNSEQGVPFYKIGTFGKKADAYISRELFEEYREKYSYPKKGDILISAAGTIGRTVIYDGEDAYYQDSNIVWLENDESLVLNRYLYYFYQLQPWYVSTGGTIKRLYNDNIRNTKIPVPPLAEQERIVAILDRFDALCNDLTSGLPAEIAARQKQYEYYRDKLLSFPALEK